MCTSAACVVAFASAASAKDYSWIGPTNCSAAPCGGDWANASYWSPSGVPSSGDTATINGASDPDSTVVTGASGTVQKLTITGNTELPNCAVTIASGGAFSWSGGVIGGKVTIPSDGTGTINGNVELSGGEIDTAGTFSWTSGVLSGDGAAIIRNSGTMTASAGTSFGYGAGTDDADLYNSGTFTFTGPGTLSDENGFWGLHNSGTVVVQSGSFELHSAGNTNSTFEDGGHISGAGTLRIYEPLSQFGTASPDSAATFTGTTTIDAGSTLEIAHGAVIDGDGTIAGPGSLVWSGGTIAANTTPAPLTWDASLVVKMTSADVKNLIGIVDNHGTVTWDAGDFGASSDAKFINTGAFTATDDLAINYGPSGGPTTCLFQNKGTFTKSGGSGALTVTSWELENDGKVDIASGTLELHNAGNLQHAINDGSSFDGTVRLVEDPSNLAPAIVVLSGTTTLNAGATLELSTASVLTGNGTVAGAGKTSMTGGAVNVLPNQSITFGKDGAVELADNPAQNVFSVDDTGTLTLAGTTTWTAGEAELDSGTLTNTGTFTAKAAAKFTLNVSTALIDNQGSIVVDPGSGTTQLDVDITSSGTLEAKSGTVWLSGYADTYVQTAGSMKLTGGSVAAYVETGDPTDPHQPRTLDLKGGRLEGAGNIDAIVNNEGATVAPGGSGVAGALKITQTYTQSASAGIELELGGSAAGQFDTLDVAGDATLDGAIAIGLVDSFLPAVGDTFKVITSPNVTGTFANVAQSHDATVDVTYDPTDVVLGVTSVHASDDGGANPGADGGSDAGAAPSGGSNSNSGGCSITAPRGAGSSLATWLTIAAAALLMRRRRER